MHVVARARHFLARHPWAYWAVVLTFAAIVAGAIFHQLSLLEDARQEWQETRSVLVADTDLQPGDSIRASSTDLPLAVLPESALDVVPNGSRLRQRVAAGEVLVAADLTQIPGPAAKQTAASLKTLPRQSCGPIDEQKLSACQLATINAV